MIILNYDHKLISNKYDRFGCFCEIKAANGWAISPINSAVNELRAGYHGYLSYLFDN